MIKVCLGAYSLRYVQGGAYMWMFLNWALGFRALGCQVIWLDSVRPEATIAEAQSDVLALRATLERFGLDRQMVVIDRDGKCPVIARKLGLDLEDATDADLFLNLGYDLASAVVARFRRSAFVDIDPGLTQLWLSRGELAISAHDIYFTLGETVGRSGTLVPDCGIDWHYTPPPVYLPAWRVTAADANAPYTTVSSWWDETAWVEINGVAVDNSKRAAFLRYSALPSHAKCGLELAISLGEGEQSVRERHQLEANGWRVRMPSDAAGTPFTFQTYVARSRGELSCMRRGYALLETAWMGERALAYLASGKPAIIEHTGRSSFLPDHEGMFRFRNLEEASRHLSTAEEDYERHCRAARSLAETYFDAERVAARVLELALP